jgi:hypothetical protein
MLNITINMDHDFKILKRIKKIGIFMFFFSPKGYFMLKQWPESTAIKDVPVTAFLAVDLLQACVKL